MLILKNGFVTDEEIARLMTVEDEPNINDLDNLGTGTSSIEANQYIKNDMNFKTPITKQAQANNLDSELKSTVRLKFFPLNKTLLKSHEVAAMNQDSSEISKMTSYMREILIAEGGYYERRLSINKVDWNAFFLLWKNKAEFVANSEIYSMMKENNYPVSLDDICYLLSRANSSIDPGHRASSVDLTFLGLNWEKFKILVTN